MGLQRRVDSQNSTFTNHHPIYRIWPGYTRSPRAVESWRQFCIIDIPSVSPKGEDSRAAREFACSQAHANVLRRFLATEAGHCVVIEDDAVLIEREWLASTDFDYFLPFVNSRDERPGSDFSIRHGILPLYGNHAGVVSRRFAEACLPLLEAGVIADHASRRIQAMRVGSYVSNGVVHDSHAASLICDERRKRNLLRPPADATVHIQPDAAAAR